MPFVGDTQNRPVASPIEMAVGTLIILGAGDWSLFLPHPLPFVGRYRPISIQTLS